MLRVLSLLFGLVGSLSWSQGLPPVATSDVPPGYCISVEPHFMHSEGPLAGMTTYRVYLNCVNEHDFLSAIGGGAEDASGTGPLVLNCDEGWYNSPANTFGTAEGVSPFLFVAFPELQYDSYVTIGAENATQMPAENLISYWGAINPIGAFLPSGGSSITVDDPVGGLWYVSFPGEFDVNNQAFAQEDLKIMMFQITTAGTFNGQAFIQVFPNADQTQEFRGVLSFDSCGLGGCTNIEACNYWADAAFDDGSCVFENCECLCYDFYSPSCDATILEPVGCSDIAACNYDPEWTCEIQDCIYPEPGQGQNSCECCCVDYDCPICDFIDIIPFCSDPASCNYQEGYACEGEFCEYPPEGDCDCNGNQLDALGVCGGTCETDANNNGICDDDEMTGCTNIEACNYWEPATFDDGSCVFENCECLCYDFYSPECDAIFLEPAGCADPLACNYDAEWTCAQQLCLYPEGELDLDNDGLCDYQDNCYNLDACNYDDPNNVGCTFPGCSDPLAIIFDPDAGCPGPCLFAGCTDIEACNYWEQADLDDGSCIYPEPGEECCCCLDYECPSCILLDLIIGCADPAACNYEEGYSCETQYCEYPEPGDCDCDGNQLDALGICGGNCESDANNNGICDDDEMTGCTQPEACNYTPQAISDDNSCIFPLVPGDCWAGATACGEGTYWNPLLQQCLAPECDACEGDLLEDGIVNTADLLVFLGAFGAVCPPTGCTDVSALNFDVNAVTNDGSCEYCAPITYNGYRYGTIQVNGRCWFAENLQTTVYANGDSIPLLTPSNSGSNYDGIGRIGLHPNPNFRAHYTWHAVTDNRGLCPVGWHVSSDLDWYSLESSLGFVPPNSGSDNGWRGDDGIQLKSQDGWFMAGNGTDALGFGGVPAGNNSGNFNNESKVAFFWSPQPSNPSTMRSRHLSHDEDGIKRGTDASYQGFSVRCVKDFE